jgi:malate dehydrogenase
MGVPADGSYDVPDGVISGYPCVCSGGQWSIVEGLDVPDFSRRRIDASVAELNEEREAIDQLGLI